METQDQAPLYCSNCEQPVLLTNRFCPTCGTSQNQRELVDDSKKWSQLQGLALFFILEIVTCLSTLFVAHPTIQTDIFFGVLMAIISVLFFSSDWKNNKHLLKWSGFSFVKLLTFIILAIIGSLMVQVIAWYLNQHVFHEEFFDFPLYQSHPFGTYIMIVSIAVFPALFEELAYRGYLLQKLLNIVDRKEAMYITSILFFLIHFSLFSFFWLLPFALLLAYIRIKENTIWYGILIHFVFNLTACLVDIIYS